jgi:hypothetical protein
MQNLQIQVIYLKFWKFYKFPAYYNWPHELGKLLNYFMVGKNYILYVQFCLKKMLKSQEPHYIGGSKYFSQRSSNFSSLLGVDMFNGNKQWNTCMS